MNEGDRMIEFFKGSSTAKANEGVGEGALCNRDKCPGIMEYERYGSCSCHINPPCSVCVDATLTCSECGFELEE